MMDAVKAGGDSQELHERIREHFYGSRIIVKEEGTGNNLLK